MLKPLRNNTHTHIHTFTHTHIMHIHTCIHQKYSHKTYVENIHLYTQKCTHTQTHTYIHTKALRGAGPRGLYLLFVAGRCGLRARPVRCGLGCEPQQAGIRGAGRAAGQDMAKYAGRGGPNDIVAGRVRAQLFQPAQFLPKFAHCLCLLVGG